MLRRKLLSLAAQLVLVTAVIAAPAALAKGAALSGLLQAVEAESRQVTVSEKDYRVSLSARIRMPDKSRISLEQLAPGALVELKLDANGDVKDLNVIVYP